MLLFSKLLGRLLFGRGKLNASWFIQQMILVCIKEDEDPGYDDVWDWDPPVFGTKLQDPLAHKLLRYPLLYRPHPKMRPQQGFMRPIWTSFWDGADIEGGTLEVYDLG